MTIKRSSEIFAAKIFSPKQVIRKSWVRRKSFPSPQTRRQVSATAFHEEGLNYVALLFPASQPRLKCCVDLDHSDLDFDYQKRVYDSTTIQITCCAHC